MNAALHWAPWVALAVVGYFGFFLQLWLWYLVAMAVDRQKNAPAVTMPNGYVVPGGVSPLVQRLVGPLYVVAISLDFVGNLLLSVALLELPREWVVTQRVTRHTEQPTSAWRTAVCLWIRVNLLDGYDRRGLHRASY